MNDVLLTWALPLVGKNQRPIAHVRIDSRVSDSLPWSPVNTVKPDGPQQLLIEDLAPGTWSFRAVVVDTAGLESKNPATTKATIDEPLVEPGDVTDFKATVQ